MIRQKQCTDCGDSFEPNSKDETVCKSCINGNRDLDERVDAMRCPYCQKRKRGWRTQYKETLCAECERRGVGGAE